MRNRDRSIEFDVNTMKLFLLVLLVGLILSAIGCNKPSTEVFDMTNKSIVKISVKCKDGDGSGSGVIVNTGIIATNAHVTSDALSVIIHDYTGKPHTPVFSIAYKDNDLAILMFSDMNSLPFIQLEDVQPVYGDMVYAFGCPLGLQNVFSVGVYNGEREAYDNSYILFNAPISPGSSGGALLSYRGRLIGLTCASIHGGQCMNLAVPVSVVKSKLKELGVIQ